MQEQATDKQRAYLLALLDKAKRSRDEVDVLRLTKREASSLIMDLLERETRVDWTGDTRVFKACRGCCVRTWEAVPVSGPCWNCGLADTA